MYIVSSFDTAETKPYIYLKVPCLTESLGFFQSSGLYSNFLEQKLWHLPAQESNLTRGLWLAWQPHHTERWAARHIVEPWSPSLHAHFKYTYMQLLWTWLFSHLPHSDLLCKEKMQEGKYTFWSWQKLKTSQGWYSLILKWVWVLWHCSNPNPHEGRKREKKNSTGFIANQNYICTNLWFQFIEIALNKYSHMKKKNFNTWNSNSKPPALKILLHNIFRFF